MKRSTIALAPAAIALALSASATADFTGYTVESFVGDQWVAQGFTGLTAWRVYANFDNPGDMLLAIGGTDMNGNVSLTSSDGLFHNDALGGLTAPLDLTGAGLWGNQWDTYVTIGATSSAGDATGTSPGFDADFGGLATSFDVDNGGWFITPDDMQGLPSGGQVLAGQFVVAAGQSIAGFFPTTWTDAAGLPHQTVATDALSVVPAPGAMALLGLAGLAGLRRRRA